MAQFVARLISPLNLSDADVRQWRAWLHSASERPSPFLSDVFVRAVAGVRPRVHVAVIEERGRNVAYFPFQFRNALSEWLGIAEPVGEYMAGYFGVVAAPGFIVDPTELLRICGLTYVGVTYLDEDQLEHGLCAQRVSTGCLIRLNDGPSEYWRQLGSREKKLIAELRRRERQIHSACGALRFEAEVEDWREPLEQLIALKRAQYVRTGRPDQLALEWKRRLLYDLAGTKDSSCRGVLSRLHAGATWVASHFGIRNGQTLSYYFPVYNPELARFAPGHLLLKAIIDSSPLTGLKLIDRGAGNSKAKREFANDTHRLYSGAWHRSGIRSLIYRASCSLKWRVRWPAATSD